MGEFGLKRTVENGKTQWFAFILKSNAVNKSLDRKFHGTNATGSKAAPLFPSLQLCFCSIVPEKAIGLLSFICK
jgi:hypothetical protein